MTQSLTKIWHYSHTSSNKDMENQISLTSKRSVTKKKRFRLNLQIDSNTGPDKDMANQSSFTSKRPTTPKSRINLNRRNDSDTHSDKM